MNLYRFRLIPESPWRTPWQADTLAGLLCWMCARNEGDAVLRQQILEPALAGRPPFVLSDAFPGDWLPVPKVVGLAEWPAEQRKRVKRAKWLPAEAFARLQRGELPAASDLLLASGIYEYTQLRNTIGRSSNITTAGGDLFATEECVLDRPHDYLTVYVRVNDAFREALWRLIHELARWGFGSDRSAGKGQFRLGSELERAAALDAPGDADGCVTLSTFQPGPDDPSDGAWDAFTKYGKLGPDFGLDNVFKRPLILLRPVACFRLQVPRGWLGRAIAGQAFLAPDAVAHLSGRGAFVIHWAFGLCVPTAFSPHKAAVTPAETSVGAQVTSEHRRLAAGAPQTVTPAAPDSAASPSVSRAPLRPAKRQAGAKVTVKVLEPHPNMVGAFFVQEPDQPSAACSPATSGRRTTSYRKLGPRSTCTSTASDRRRSTDGTRLNRRRPSKPAASARREEGDDDPTQHSDLHRRHGQYRSIARKPARAAQEVDPQG